MIIDADEKKILNYIRYMPILFIFILSIFVTKIVVYQKKENFKKDIKIIENVYLETNKNRVKEEIEKISKQIKLEKENRKTSLNEDSKNKLKEQYLKRIRNITFGETGYIFLYNLEGTCLAHFRKEYIGVNRIGIKDSNGNLVIKNILDFAKKNKSGFMSYITIMKPKDTIKNREKISYIKLINDWDWIIGAGFYLDSLDNKIDKEKEKLIESNAKSIEKIGYIALLITIIMLIISFYFSMYIKKVFLKYKIKIKEQNKTLLTAQKVAHIGDWKLDLKTKKIFLSNEIIHILGFNRVFRNKFDLEYLKNSIMSESLSSYEKFINNLIIGDKEHRSTYKIKRTDNEIRWIDCRGRLDKNKSFIIGTMQDITKEVKLREEKLSQEKILCQQSKMAAMGEMIGNIAHQWKQPLSLISLSNGLLKINREVKGFNTEKELDEAIEKIEENVEHLSNTIDDFRNFFEPNKETSLFSLDKAIKKTIKLTSAQFVSEEIKIIQDIDSIQIDSYENEFIHVLMNILNNARDALKDKKYDKFIFITTRKEDNHIVIKIKDNAGGIPNDIMEKIFEPYFTTKKEIQGTGIGLYMSEEIITKHMKGILTVQNSEYTYENKSYTGAEFTIKLKQIAK